MAHSLLSPSLSLLSTAEARIRLPTLSTLITLLAAPDLVFCVSIASGVAAHVLVFRHGEWDVRSPAIAVTYGLVFLTIAWALHALRDAPISAAVAITAYHVLGLFSSMLVYRAFLHRLRRYPGPFLARLSNFYITAVSAKRLHLFEEVQKLHAQYGDIVRLGPSELSIATPEAANAIYSSKSPTVKGPWYELLEPRHPLFMLRDKEEHARRRKIWDQGFTTKALLGYEPRINRAVDQLLQVIQKANGECVNVSRYFSLLMFEIIEDLAFNKSANMVIDGHEDYIHNAIRSDMYNIGFFAHLPWLLPFFKRIPVLNWEYLKFMRCVTDHLVERSNNEPAEPDLLTWLLAAYRKTEHTKHDWDEIHADTQLILVGGTDSSSTALTHTFFHLAHDPVRAHILRREFDALPDLTNEQLSKIPLLDAVINETLRLHPPVPSGTQRMTPPEGLTIGSEHIPGNVIVQVPTYTISRDPRSFVQPNEFIPERWTTRPELVKDRSAFIPFNIGRYACVGKRLAMMKFRRVVAEVLTRYDLALPPGHDAHTFLDGKQDVFTTVPGQLDLIFTKRTDKQVIN